MTMNNFKLLTDFLYQVAIEIYCIVCNNGFWYAKTTYDVGMNEVHNHFLGNLFERDSFYQFDKVIDGK